MINGQLNAASQQQVTPLAALEPLVPVTGAMNGDTGFADMLGGIQSLVKEKVLPDPRQAGQLLNENGKDQLHLEAGAENAAVDLLALLQVSPLIAAVLEPAAQKSEDSEKTEVTADAVPLHSEPSDITSQMVLAAYAQPGRMPEVNIPPPLPVGTLQKAAILTEQAALVAAQPIEEQLENLVAEARPTAPSQSEKQSQPTLPYAFMVTIPMGAPQAVKSDRMSEVNIPAPLPVDTLQKAVALTGQAVLTAAQSDKTQAGQPAAGTTPAQTELPAAHPAAAVSAGNIPAAAVQEAHTGRQLINPEQQLEKGRTGGEPVIVKEMATSLQSIASASETTLGSDTPQSGDSNQMLEQQMRGQLSTEHQKVTAIPAKEVPAESVRQDIPEQVMHQVKERLLQHELKPGSQQITLTLSPDSLGELKMSLNLQGQKLSVEILTENRTVRDAIVLHADALKESLARQNITMESFDVTTGGKGSGGQGQNQNAWRELAKGQQQQQLWSSPRGYNTAQTDLPSGHGAYQREQGQTMLDIHY
jgi:flagellar hook-length control protein FliK